jgi:hypothetical protein
MSFPSPGDGKPAVSSAPVFSRQAANTNSQAYLGIMAISKLPLTLSGKAKRETMVNVIGIVCPAARTTL